MRARSCGNIGLCSLVKTMALRAGTPSELSLDPSVKTMALRAGTPSELSLDPSDIVDRAKTALASPTFAIKT